MSSAAEEMRHRRRQLLALLVLCWLPGACCYVNKQRSQVSSRSAASPLAKRRREPEHSWSLETIPNAARHVMASSMSGAIAVTVLAPLEVIRLNLLSNPEISLRAAFSSLKGARFRGNTADVISGSARIGIIMPAFSFYKGLAGKLATQLDPSRDPDAPVPGWGIFAAGAMAGCTATAILFPLEVARTRMAMECNIDSVYSCLETIWTTEGLVAMYRGLTTSLSGVMPFNAIKLSSYDILRTQAAHIFGSASLPAVCTAAIGACAGVTAATTMFPVEVIRRRQMMGEFAGLSVFPALRALARAEGGAALYRGVYVNMVKVSLSNSIGFVLYELMKDMLRVDGRVPAWKQAHKLQAEGVRQAAPRDQ